MFPRANSIAMSKHASDPAIESEITEMLLARLMPEAREERAFARHFRTLLAHPIVSAERVDHVSCQTRPASVVDQLPIPPAVHKLSGPELGQVLRHR